MDYYKLSAVSTAVIALATVLGAMFALIYYLHIMIEANFIQIILAGIIYIVFILSFLYYLKQKENEKK